MPAGAQLSRRGSARARMLSAQHRSPRSIAGPAACGPAEGKRLVLPGRWGCSVLGLFGAGALLLPSFPSCPCCGGRRAPGWGVLGGVRCPRERGGLGAGRFRSEQREQSVDMPVLALAVFGVALPPVSESRWRGGSYKPQRGEEPAALQCCSARKAAGVARELGSV